MTAGQLDNEIEAKHFGQDHCLTDATIHLSFFDTRLGELILVLKTADCTVELTYSDPIVDNYNFFCRCVSVKGGNIVDHEFDIQMDASVHKFVIDDGDFSIQFSSFKYRIR
jgi:hypothetical protein